MYTNINNANKEIERLREENARMRVALNAIRGYALRMNREDQKPVITERFYALKMTKQALYPEE